MLCKGCVKSTLAAGSEVNVNFDENYLVVDGLCVLEFMGDIDMVIRPGDFATPPSLDPASPEHMTAFEYGDDTDAIARVTKLHAVKESTCAVFGKEYINGLFSFPEFSRAMYENLREFSGHAMYFQTRVNGQSAYGAVKQVLKFARTYHLGELTHAQIAYLAGRGRSTVTQAMHEIALAEPEVLEGLGQPSD